jgi:hypothetical protein
LVEKNKKDHDTLLIAILNYKIDSLHHKIDSKEYSSASTINSLKLALNELAQERDSLKYKSENSILEKKIQTLKKDADKKIADIKNYTPTGFKIAWLSFSYDILNKRFKLFDPDNSYDKQIIQKNYTAHTVGMQLNYYKSSTYPGESFYLSGGVNFIVDDNKADLTAVNIDETYTITDSLNTRTYGKNCTAYVGKYEAYKGYINPSVNFYYFLRNNKGAFHVFPDAVYGKKRVPAYNMGLGFMLVVKNKKETEKGLLNAELFFKINDISNNQVLASTYYDRTAIGLKFTFPLNFTNIN